MTFISKFGWWIYYLVMRQTVEKEELLISPYLEF
jgi:hypothetical protein